MIGSRRLIAVSASVACLSCAIGVTGAGARTPAVRASAPIVTAAANEAAARTEAAAILAQLALPPGAAASATEPAGDNEQLAASALGFIASPNRVAASGWWVVPGAPATVLAYVAAHRPAGSTPRGSGGGLKSAQIEASKAEGFSLGPVVGVLGTRLLNVTVVGLPDGSTGLRADAEVIWLTPRDPSEVIPGAVHLLRVSVLGLPGSHPKQRPLTVRAPHRIAATVALLNALPVVQPGTRSCPADDGVKLRLAFYAGAHARAPLAVATDTVTGCGGVALTLAGREQPALESAAFAPKFERVIGVKLKLTPPPRY